MLGFKLIPRDVTVRTSVSMPVIFGFFFKRPRNMLFWTWLMFTKKTKRILPWAGLIHFRQPVNFYWLFFCYISVFTFKYSTCFCRLWCPNFYEQILIRQVSQAPFKTIDFIESLIFKWQSLSFMFRIGINPGCKYGKLSIPISCFRDC